MSLPPKQVSPADYEAARILQSEAASMPCAYCRREMVYGDKDLHPTRDHIWTKTVRSMHQGRVGRLWCCSACNLEKGDMLPSEWLAVLRSREQQAPIPASELPPDHPDYVPGCNFSGRCEVSAEDEASGCAEAMCVLCGGWRYRNHPYEGNWGYWTPDLATTEKT
ncbi:MAG: hypothetical protein ABJN42_24840 [Roseibium sp.]|uniref:hypothetical protein n=1 Tax=Roseibium sp. TaxID=1936156 RepID=UPI0032968C9A